MSKHRKFKDFGYLDRGFDIVTYIYLIGIDKIAGGQKASNRTQSHQQEKGG